MGKNLADFIERFILNKFINGQNEYILMCRNDLAVELSCAPSQISYVLNTRFTPEKGFIVESRRGAGGFVKIVRLVEKTNKTFVTAEQILHDLYTEKVITERECSLLNFLLEIHSSFLTKEDKISLLKDALSCMEIADLSGGM